MSEPNRVDGPSGLEVAVIGMACRFPGAGNVDEFWRNLCDGVESITHLSDEELAAAGESPELIARPDYVRVARSIPGDTLFDATLFGFSPREAELVDPQQRLFLECAWEALEHAGHDPSSFPGQVGVYGGVKLNSYLWHIYANPQLLAAAGELNAQIANDRDYLATRVSYKLGLGGPSLTVQTACSTSLVAIHLACQALLGGECQMALAGGVSVKTQQAMGYVYHEGEILSPDGRVRAFDAAANGTIFGNGLGIVVLRRLADALADGDRIYAVIRGSAVNNDSAQRVGFTAPGADGQERVIRAAHAAAEVAPETITYVEAHGTGTPVGDPIELTALTRAFRASTQKQGFCAIGSVKTNIGHLASAAGVAGVIKTCLALHHKAIPPSLLLTTPNPQIDWAASPFYVVQRLTSWAADGTPRRAGVSAFGIGGTNAHAVLEEAPPLPEPGPSRPWQLLLLSARTETALAAVTANLAGHLGENPALALPDVAFTLQVGRRALDHRRMLVCREVGEAAGALSSLDPARVFTRAAESRQAPVAFLFPGQGAQHAGMLAGVYAGEALFREQIARCAELLVPHLGLDLRGLLYPPAAEREEAGRRLQQTAFTQPALFAVEYALAELWMSWGVQPAAMLGHSIGEYVAACLAGVMSLADALAVVAARGRLMQGLPAGAMASVALAPEEIEPLLGSQLSLAAHNAPRRVVVSGPEDAVAALAERLAGRGVDCRRLRTSHAFHSRMMEPVLAPFAAELSRIELKPPRLPYVSNSSGTWVTAAEATDPGYWAHHLLGTVRFSAGLELLLEEPNRVLLEVGPGQTLTALSRQHSGRRGGQVIVAAARRVDDERDDHAQLLSALGQVWLAGGAVDWRGFYGGEERRRLALPTYPFERRRYWIGPPASGFTLLPGGPARTRELADWFYLPYWKPSAPQLPAAEAGMGGDIGTAAGVAGAATGAGGGWLLFADDLGLGSEMAEVLGRRGERVAVVVPGQRFAAHSGRVFEIAPARPEDYDALFAALATADEPPFGLPGRIVHLWTLTSGDQPRSFPGLASLEELGFYSLLYLGQALGRQMVRGRIDLTVISNGLHEVHGGEAVCPEKALVLGPCKVMPQEYAYLACRSVDVVPPAGDEERGELIELLLGEIASEGWEQIVAYRRGRRWLQAFEPVTLAGAPAARLPLRERGVYLITGGLGGIGLALAEHLARTLSARLVLTSRGALPPRDSWAEELSRRPAGDALGDRIRQVQKLELLGGEVMVAAADVADEQQMLALVAGVRRAFGEVNGVIHCAGLPGGGIVQTKTRATAASVLAPKVRGARALEAALDGTKLDFMALCSSTIAVLGNFGQVDYCAANCFLDAFARDYAARHEVPAFAINWGAWSEAGMAVQAVAAPESPLNRQAPREGGLAEPPAPPLHPLLDSLESDAAGKAVFTTLFSPSTHWVLAEHHVLGTPTLPGTTYLEMARAAYEHLGGEPAAELREVFFLTPMMIPFGESREARLVVERQGAGCTFRIASRPAAGAAADHGGGKSKAEAGWIEHAFGEIGPAGGDHARAGRPRRLDLDEIRGRCATVLALGPGHLLADTEAMVYWGPHWQTMKTAEYGAGEALVTLELPEELAADLDRYVLHPALLDVATSVLTFRADTDGGELEYYLPISYRRLRIGRPLPARVHCHLRSSDYGGKEKETLSADIELLDDTGEVLVEIEGFVEKKVGAAAGRLQRVATPGAPAATRAEPAAAVPANPVAAEAPEPAAAAVAATGETAAVTPEAGAATPEAAVTPEASAATPDAAVPTEAPASAAPMSAPDARRGRLAAEGMRNDQGVEAFLRVLSLRPGAQVVVSPLDLPALLAQMARARAHDLEGDAARLAPPRPAHPRPDVSTAFTAPRSDLERRLAEVWQDVLGIDAIGVDDNFYELGGDSVLGVQILARARQSGIELTNNQLFEHQTIAAIAVAMGGAAGIAATAAAAAAATAAPAGTPAPAGRPPGIQPLAGDLALAALPPAVRDRLVAEGDLEDVYPLSPLQQGLLFHSLAAPDSALYQEQLSFALPSEIDQALFEQAWQLSIRHHPALRTTFLWEDLDRPLQLVHRRVELAIECTDLRGVPAAERGERLASWRRADREQPFQLSTVPLMRMRLARLADDHYEALWTHHHLLLDGWSSPMLMREVFASYRALHAGVEPQLAPTRPFRDYVEWLERRDPAVDEEFWRRVLAGFTRPTGIGADRPPTALPAAVSDFATREATLSEPLTAALQALARHRRMTLNTFAKGMWALLLGHAGGETDVVFGISVSTRPGELENIESAVGLFINTLPFRARLGAQAALLPWLEDLLRQQQEMLDHVQAPAVEVKRWSEVPAELPLFESVLEFWNFPLDDVLRQSIVAGEGRYEVATHYPLSLRVIPGPAVHMQLTYDRRRFDDATAARLLRGMETALAALAEAGPETTLAEIETVLEEKEREARRQEAGEVAGRAQEKLRQGLGAAGRRRGVRAEPAP